MKRRVFTQGLLFSVFCGPALAADPLPTLQETPMFAEQVKSGALPPVAERIPNPPWIVRKFAGGDGPGRPAQYAGGERPRYAPDDDLQLHAPDRVRRPVQIASRHSRELRSQGRPGIHLQAARRP